tara:strand:- start:91 stop:243 length:153 start_codon:yes stop_codon:yes gene_type:complete
MVNEVSNLLERGIHIKTLDGRLNITAMPREITMPLVSILLSLIAICTSTL